MKEYILGGIIGAVIVFVFFTIYSELELKRQAAEFHTRMVQYEEEIKRQMELRGEMIKYYEGCLENKNVEGM